MENHSSGKGIPCDSFHQLLESITPTIYNNLKRAVELGKWADGRVLSKDQVALCLQAIIVYESKHLPEERRSGYMPDACKTRAVNPEESTDADEKVTPLSWQD